MPPFLYVIYMTIGRNVVSLVMTTRPSRLAHEPKGGSGDEHKQQAPAPDAPHETKPDPRHVERRIERGSATKDHDTEPSVRRRPTRHSVPVLANNCSNDPIILRRWRCPHKYPVHIDSAIFEDCKFCNYLNRPNPISIEPVADEPRDYRAVGGTTIVVNKASIRARWANQSRLAALVPIEEAPRRVYLDFGARRYPDSVAEFLRQFPKSDQFELKAWEAMPAFASTYKNHSEVEFHNEAVWVSDGEMWMANSEMAYAVPDVKYARSRGLVKGAVFSIPSVDISAYIKRNFKMDDFIICKMDIEGAEFHIIPKMIEDGTIHLLDEVLIECHYYEGNFLPNVKNMKWSDCFKMFTQLRQIGVYSHEWLL
eukprot:NODE_3339_length_1237_cov_88.483842_g3170_i0.p1 GENE.NODE_3339_length_1237_cov_88.483842_g3170_i0~~NODE_3339_length_1237_cov_88.483842_g3170_i0.p1  ORF type:complete len:400 (+),score=47.80 NODE_3339_length_1237_cov_88.483842_g3170_i0:101-1201(+)